MSFLFTARLGSAVLTLGLLAALPASAQWALQRPPSGLHGVTDVHFTDANRGYASAAIGGLARTVDGGQTWTDVPTGVSSSLRDVFFVTPDSGYVVGNVGVVIRTTDGGRTWQRRDLANAGASVNGVYAHSGRRVLVTQGDQIFSSSDGGATWAPIYTYNGPLSIFSFRHLEFATPQTGYAVGGYSGSFGNVSQVVKTTDGGRTWQLLPSQANTGPMGGVAAVAFPDASTGYLADVQDRLFKTTDGGQTWTQVASRGAFGSFYGMHFTNALTGYGVGFDGNLRRTLDGGLTWLNQTANPGDTYAAVYFPTPAVGYAGGVDSGSGARIIKYTETVSGTTKGALTGVSVYPNPAAAAVKIAGLPAAQPAQATVYGSDGRRVLAATLAPGETQLQTAGLAPGLYVLRVESRGHSFQQKLVIE